MRKQADREVRREERKDEAVVAAASAFYQQLSFDTRNIDSANNNMYSQEFFFRPVPREWRSPRRKPGWLPLALKRAPGNTLACCALHSDERVYELHADAMLFFIGSMNEQVCHFCRARFWDHETWRCCGKGRIHLPIPRAPTAAQRMVIPKFTGGRAWTPAGVFQKYARQINSAMAFASFLCTEPSRVMGNNWLPFLIVNGAVKWCVGSLLPADGQIPKFSQIYFVGDGDDQADFRMQLKNFRSVSQGNSVVLRSILQAFERDIKKHHSFYSHARQTLDEEKLHEPGRGDCTVIFMQRNGKMHTGVGEGAYNVSL